MKERPILFSTPMVRALFAGNKTMTRRVVMPQPDPDKLNIVQFNDSPWPFTRADGSADKCPYGEPGELLWVRETWLDNYAWCQESFGFIDAHEYPIHYKADSNHLDISQKRVQKWKPSIHMPKKNARLWLKVKTVRVERLQEISENDALAEGPAMVNDKDGVPYQTATTAFMALWDRINFKRGYGWGKNPWVWAVGFERVDHPPAIKEG